MWEGWVGREANCSGACCAGPLKVSHALGARPGAGASVRVQRRPACQPRLWRAVLKCYLFYDCDFQHGIEWEKKTVVLPGVGRCAVLPCCVIQPLLPSVVLPLCKPAWFLAARLQGFRCSYGNRGPGLV